MLAAQPRHFQQLKGDHVKRLKELEADSASLRQAVSNPALDKMIIAEAAREKPRQMRQLAGAGATTPSSRG